MHLEYKQDLKLENIKKSDNYEQHPNVKKKTSFCLQKKESVKFYRLLSNFIFLHLKFNFDKNSF